MICHPKLVETGLDLLAFPTLYFYETGYSLHTLRQASRRSWRIGQRFPVRVKFVTYSGTMQETCLRPMGKKMLVALMMEGKFSGEGLQALDADGGPPRARWRANLWRRPESENPPTPYGENSTKRGRRFSRAFCWYGVATGRGSWPSPSSVRDTRPTSCANFVLHSSVGAACHREEAEEVGTLANRRGREFATQSVRMNSSYCNLRGNADPLRGPLDSHRTSIRSIENFAGHGRRRHNLLTTAQTP